MKQALRLGWVGVPLLLLTGCMMLSPKAAETAAPPHEVQGIVFAVDGAGGFEAASRTLRETAEQEKMPLEVRGFHWTHGYCRVLSDQIHRSYMRRQGQTLADMVLRCREESPSLPIYLLGHSAGCGVVLTAAESLPPGFLERIVLLAPAVSVKHDLRPALATACRGIDVFYSEHDWACLGLGVWLAGTTDRCWTAAAGKVGFCPLINSPEDRLLYDKLRQYPWDPSLSWTGNKGGRYGSYQPDFLRAFILPLLHPYYPGSKEPH